MANKWIEHLAKIRSEEMAKDSKTPQKDIMKKAKESYKKE